MRRLLMLLVVCGLVSLVGCNKKRSAAEQSGGAVARSGAAAPTTAVASGRPYRAEVRMPGATVSGFETTQVRSKVGGYVGRIGKVDGQDIDRGTEVTAGTLLAKLDIPETLESLAEKEAIVEQTRSALAQADAAIEEARARVVQRQAELQQVRAHRAEKQATLDLNEKKLQRLSGLAESGAIGTETLDEAEFAVAAARAALEGVAADEKVAESNILAAEAGVQSAIADKGSAAAQIRVAEA